MGIFELGHLQRFTFHYVLPLMGGCEEGEGMGGAVEGCSVRNGFVEW